MSSLVTINDVQIEQLTYAEQRVVTFAQVAEVHGVPVANIQKSFQRNKARFVEGEDYIRVDPSDVERCGLSVQTGQHGAILLTENGYLLLVKPLRDDVSWSVQKQMRDAYFAQRHAEVSRAKSPVTPARVMLGLAQELVAMEQRVETLEDKVAAIQERTPPTDRMTTKDFLRRYSKPYLPPEVLRVFNATCRKMEDPIRFTPQGFEYPWLYYTLETLMAAYDEVTRQLSFFGQGKARRHFLS
jgi:hypothetical protein